MEGLNFYHSLQKMSSLPKLVNSSITVKAETRGHIDAAVCYLSQATQAAQGMLNICMMQPSKKEQGFGWMYTDGCGIESMLHELGVIFPLN